MPTRNIYCVNIAFSMGSYSKLVSLSPEICSLEDINDQVGHALRDHRRIKRIQLPSYEMDSNISKSKVNLTISPEKIDRLYYCKGYEVDDFSERFELYCRTEYEGSLYFVSMRVECESVGFVCNHVGEIVFTKDYNLYFQNVICRDFRNTVKVENPDFPYQNVICRYFRNTAQDKIVLPPSLYFQHVIVRDYRNSVKAKIRQSLLEDGYIIS